ncbi:MAG: restriction endonuclease subunit S [Gammaproteobacteria bacterium]|nr:restriction endonuclease subunit S [Gammaproteobacteria bacterium]
MNTERLLALYDRVADAPDAIDRLRRFVIDLAVRGKLVEQNPADEPASDLLKRIAAEKARLVKAGKLKRRRLASRLDKLPFSLPKGWRWARIREVVSDRGQVVPDRPFTYIDVSAINKEAGLVADPRVVEPDNAPSRARKVARPGDVVYSCVRPYLLNVAIIEADFNPRPIASTAFEVLNGHGLVLPRYTWMALRSSFMIACVEQRQRGQAYPAINSSDFAVLPFPLAPLAEQRRIVAKVDELMALCDRLGETRAAREDTRDRLTKASLARLTAPDTDAAAFRGHARFAIHALPALTARPDQVRHLRQTILSLAVRGKLVEQNPANEPASQLLEQIAVKKARLLKARKIRKRKPREPLSPPESAFGLPSGWTAARLSDVVVELQTGPFGSSLHKSDYEMGGTPVVNPASIRNGRIVPVAKMAVGTDTLERLAHFKLRAGDIVMGRRGEMGRCAVVAEDEDGWLCGTGSLILRLPDSVCAEYLATLIGSPDVREYLQGSSVGTTMRNLNQSILLAMSIGLPPLAEQHRIVAKVDALMALCDQLEAEAGYADRIRSRLLDSLLHESLASQEASINGTVGGGARVWT